MLLFFILVVITTTLAQNDIYCGSHVDSDDGCDCGCLVPDPDCNVRTFLKSNPSSLQCSMNKFLGVQHPLVENPNVLIMSVPTQKKVRLI